ncbi:MAG: hypothetical protein U0797_12945 [Gemmataceae bacterium]
MPTRTVKVRCTHCGQIAKLPPEEVSDCTTCPHCLRYFDATDQGDGYDRDDSARGGRRDGGSLTGRRRMEATDVARRVVWVAHLIWLALVASYYMVTSYREDSAVRQAARAGDAIFWASASYFAARAVDSSLRRQRD